MTSIKNRKQPPPPHPTMMMITKPPFNSTQNQIDWGPSPSPSRIPIDFSPPLIAMVVVVATAFFIVTYFRLISRHLLPPIFFLLQRWRNQWLQWRHHSSPSTTADIESLPSNTFDSNSTYHFYTSYNGLDEDAIKTIPLSTYTKQKSRRDCAVCLLEFEEHDYVRTLPSCAHAFHVDCIDVWLSCHANCPLCRGSIFRQESSSSPFVPLMAARIRPSLDGILESIIAESHSVDINESTTETSENHSLIRIETTEEARGDFLLKRSYSFGFERFERSLATDRIAMEAATATPWRYRRGNFWSKRPSPFNAVGKHRVFSFRYYRGMKSPFSRRRSSGLFPLSESNVRYGGGGVGGGGGSSRRSKSMTSPMFMRSTAFSSSRLRCGDLEALLSPERLNRR